LARDSGAVNSISDMPIIEAGSAPCIAAPASLTRTILPSAWTTIPSKEAAESVRNRSSLAFSASCACSRSETSDTNAMMSGPSARTTRLVVTSIGNSVPSLRRPRVT
jgi:hypothetical protein